MGNIEEIVDKQELLPLPMSESKRYDGSDAEYICVLCGKEIKNPKYYIHVYAGSLMYPHKYSTYSFEDTWIDNVGNECVKKIKQQEKIQKEKYIFVEES